MDNKKDQGNNSEDISSLSESFPWPKGYNATIEDKIKKIISENPKKPLYFCIASSIDEEASELLSQVRLKRKLKMVNEATYRIHNGFIEGLQILFAEMNWARMLEESNGDIKIHPESVFADDPNETIQGLAPVFDDSEPLEQAEFLLEDNDILRMIRKDPSGISFLDWAINRREEESRKKGINPNMDARQVGFKHGVERYKELYQEFSKSKQ